MGEPRWLVDEMLGRLSRYLRFLGYDTEYVRGKTDEAIATLSGQDDRRLITRDRALARRVTGSILLTQTDLPGQMQELGRAFPELRHVVRLERCTLCNGKLVPAPGTAASPSAIKGLPLEVRDGQTPLFVCSTCGHSFWPGSHTRAVQSRLAEWFPEGGTG